MSYVLGDKALRQIRDVVLKVLREPTVVPRDDSRRNPVFEQCCYGKLTTSLAPDGTGTLTIYRPGSGGGVGTDTGVTLTVIDNGKLNQTLPSSTVCDVAYMRGAWVVTGHECI